MGEGNAAIQSGVPVVRGGGSVMTHTAGSVTMHSKYRIQMCDSF
jgi:hypothetical protein